MDSIIIEDSYVFSIGLWCTVLFFPVLLFLNISTLIHVCTFYKTIKIWQLAGHILYYSMERNNMKFEVPPFHILKAQSPAGFGVLFQRSSSLMFPSHLWNVGVVRARFISLTLIYVYFTWISLCSLYLAQVYGRIIHSCWRKLYQNRTVHGRARFCSAPFRFAVLTVFALTMV